MRTLRCLALVAATSLTGACAESGALSQVSFGAGCKGGGACLGGLDAPLAVGTRQTIVADVDIPGTGAPPLVLESIAPEVFRMQGDAAIAVAPGLGALLVTGPDGLVLDFIHLWVAQPDQLVPIRRGPEGATLGRLAWKQVLLAGDEIVFSMEPFAGSQQLMGDFDVTWTGTGEVVALLPAGVDDWQRLVARAPGKTTLTAEALGMTARIDVEVLP